MNETEALRIPCYELAVGATQALCDAAETMKCAKEIYAWVKGQEPEDAKAKLKAA